MSNCARLLGAAFALASFAVAPSPLVAQDQWSELPYPGIGRAVMSGDTIRLFSATYGLRVEEYVLVRPSTSWRHVKHTITLAELDPREPPDSAVVSLDGGARLLTR